METTTTLHETFELMKATIKDKKEIATGTLLVTFDLLGKEIEFKPGQYFYVTLPELLYSDDRGNRRQFSIVNSPNEKGLLTMTTRLSESGFKKTLEDLPLGREIEAGPIAGTLVLPEDVSQQLVFIADGIGITPFMSMLRYIKEESLAYKVKLIYSNINREGTAFLEELQRMAKENSNFELIASMTQDEKWDGEKRRVDVQFIKDHCIDLDNSLFMIVGPAAMNEAVTSALASAGVDGSHIKTENFLGYK